MEWNVEGRMGRGGMGGSVSSLSITFYVVLTFIIMLCFTYFKIIKMRNKNQNGLQTEKTEPNAIY